MKTCVGEGLGRVRSSCMCYGSKQKKPSAARLGKKKNYTHTLDLSAFVGAAFATMTKFATKADTLAMLIST